MMVTIMLESFSDRIEELMPLLPLHYQELALDQENVPLSPQYDVYLERDRRGELMFLAVRKDGDLIGYFLGFIAPGLHYSTCLTLTMDIFYLHPDHRGSDIGFRLFKAVEDEAKYRGVQRMFVGSKCHLDASWLFERLGYKKVETYYSNWLED